MPMSVTESNKYLCKMFCAYLDIEAFLDSLDIEAFKVDYYLGSLLYPDERKRLRGICGEESVYPPVIKWKKDGVWYRASVPIKTRARHWLDDSSYDVVDWEAIEEAAKNIIIEHNERTLLTGNKEEYPVDIWNGWE